ncbi:MAG: 23S rRNA (guanosine(2251)-2'-O)-methyltransferase RlmB [Planctomycetaceae bacterium]
MSIRLQNPHSVLAVLQTRPSDVADIQLASRNPSVAWENVANLAAARHVPVRVNRHRPTGSRRKTNHHEKQGGRSGGSFATVQENSGVSLEELFPESHETTPTNGLYLALDCLQDPHNVGAIFRSAAFFGVKGIVLTKDRSAPLNGTVYDVASGGVEYVPFSVQTNLARALDMAQKNGLWILGTSEHAETDFRDVQADRSWLLVVGNEEKGMRRLTQEKCDVICKLEPQSPVSSLNVSVATGVFIAALSGAVSAR